MGRVDIMSLSLGLKQTPYFKDLIAIASLSAIEKGIFVVCAADMNIISKRLKMKHLGSQMLGLAWGYL